MDKSNNLKRRNESDNSTNTTKDTKRQRPKLNMNQGPRIPVRSTLASRSNRNSPTTTKAEKRVSNISTSSSTSSVKSTVSSRSSSQQQTNTVHRLSTPTFASSKRHSNPTSQPPTQGVKRLIKKPVTKKVTEKKNTIEIPNFTGDIKGKMNYLQTQLENSGEQCKKEKKKKQNRIGLLSF